MPSKRCSSRTVTYMHTVAMAGKDRSIPPESMTTNTPMAIVPMIELLFRMSKMFSAVKKELADGVHQDGKDDDDEQEDELMAPQKGALHSRPSPIVPAPRPRPPNPFVLSGLSFSMSRISLSEAAAASSSAPIRPSFINRMRCE